MKNIFSPTKEFLNEQIDLIELTDSIVKTISDQQVEANVNDLPENNEMPLETRNNSVVEEDIICLDVEDDNQCSFCLLNFGTQSKFFLKLN